MSLDLRAIALAQPPFTSYRPLPYRGEGFRAVVASCSCACGLDLQQLAGESKGDSLRRHHQTAEHADYRAWKEEE